MKGGEPPGCLTKHRRRDGAHSRRREEAEPGGSISGCGCEALPPLHRGELPLCVLSVPPVGLPLGRADRPAQPLVPLRSHASPRKGRTGTRLRVVRPQRAAEALPGARGVSASLGACATSQRRRQRAGSDLEGRRHAYGCKWRRRREPTGSFTIGRISANATSRRGGTSGTRSLCTAPTDPARERGTDSR